MGVHQNEESQGLEGQWDHLLSEQATSLRESEIRALFSVVSRPEVVSLAGGMPNLQDLPLADIADATRKLVENDGHRAMQYGDGHGWNPLRRQIVEVMAKEGIDGDPELVQITTGSQQALQFMTDMFVNPGDVILAESPSYVGALGIFQARMADVVQVPMDDGGLIPEELRRAIHEVRESGREIKFLYTIPNYHNPAGVSLLEERRPQITEICREEGVLIVEDNPYGLLGFDKGPTPALQSYWPEGVVYLGSFSKIFAPGYRIGWALAPREIYEKLVLATEAGILCPSMMGQMSISTYLGEFDWYSQVREFAKMYEGRWHAMEAALDEYLPDLERTTPLGGFYTWVTLPEGFDAKQMLPRAVEHLVAYVPGTAFYADGQGKNRLRLSFCYPTEDEIREGVRRLADTIRDERALLAVQAAAQPAEAAEAA